MAVIRVAFARSLRSRLPRVALFSSGASDDESGETETALVQQEWEAQRIVIAVGGNALQRRGERLTIENQLKAAADAAPAIKALSEKQQVVLTHGNGPQVGELALERSAATFVRRAHQASGSDADPGGYKMERGDPLTPATPPSSSSPSRHRDRRFDVLGAESQGQIGYVFAQAMANVGLKACPILTQVRIERTDPAFQNPTKFIGPVYGAKEGEALAKARGIVLFFCRRSFFVVWWSGRRARGRGGGPSAAHLARRLRARVAGGAGGAGGAMVAHAWWLTRRSLRHDRPSDQGLGWVVKPDGEYYRRVVPSPMPVEIFQVGRRDRRAWHRPRSIVVGAARASPRAKRPI